MADTRTPVIAIDCWHKGCDFSELVKGIVTTHLTAYYSDARVWAEHNRKVHGR